LFGAAGDEGWLAGVWVVSLAISALFYFLPTFVAGMRGHPNTAAIAVLNILLGCTLVGWVVALVWSFTAVPPPRRKRRRVYEEDDD